MKYRVGRKQKRSLLHENGLEITLFSKGQEQMAQQVCDLLNNDHVRLKAMNMSEQEKAELADISYLLNLQNLSGREDFQQAFKLGIMTGIDETIEKLNE
jgi:hypothetical protein